MTDETRKRLYPYWCAYVESCLNYEIPADSLEDGARKKGIEQ